MTTPRKRHGPFGDEAAPETPGLAERAAGWLAEAARAIYAAAFDEVRQDRRRQRKLRAREAAEAQALDRQSYLDNVRLVARDIAATGWHVGPSGWRPIGDDGLGGPVRDGRRPVGGLGGGMLRLPRGRR